MQVNKTLCLRMFTEKDTELNRVILLLPLDNGTYQAIMQCHEYGNILLVR